MIIDFNKLNEMMSNNEEGALIGKIEVLNEYAKVTDIIKIFAEARTDRGYSMDNAYFKVIADNGKKEVRIKFKAPEYVMHTTKLMLNSDERAALIKYFKIKEPNKWLELIIATNKQLQFNMINPLFRIPEIYQYLIIQNYQSVKRNNLFKWRKLMINYYENIYYKDKSSIYRNLVNSFHWIDNSDIHLNLTSKYNPKSYIKYRDTIYDDICYALNISKKSFKELYSKGEIIVSCDLSVMDEFSYFKDYEIQSIEKSNGVDTDKIMYSRPDLCTSHDYEYIFNVNKFVSTKYTYGVSDYFTEIHKWNNINVTNLKPGTMVTLQDFKSYDCNMSIYQGIVLKNKKRSKELSSKFNDIQIICLDTDRFFDTILDDVADHIVSIDGYDYDKLVSMVKSWGGESDPEGWIRMINEPYV